jgi:hypothetical protein
VKGRGSRRGGRVTSTSPVSLYRRRRLLNLLSEQKRRRSGPSSPCRNARKRERGRRRNGTMVSCSRLSLPPIVLSIVRSCRWPDVGAGAGKVGRLCGTSTFPCLRFALPEGDTSSLPLLTAHVLVTGAYSPGAPSTRRHRSTSPRCA